MKNTTLITFIVAAGLAVSAAGCADTAKDNARLPSNIPTPTVPSIQTPPVTVPSIKGGKVTLPSGPRSSTRRRGAAQATVPTLAFPEAVEQLEVGDCLADNITPGEVASLRTTSCSNQHRGEIVSSFDSSAKDWPGRKSVTAEAGRRCTPSILAAGEQVLRTRRVGISFLSPVQSRWSEDDREVLCIASTKRPFSGALRSGS